MKQVAVIILTVLCSLLVASQGTMALAQESESAAVAEDKAGAASGVAKAASEAAQSDEAETSEPTLAEALSGGKATINLRYRFEFVDDDRLARNGQASTLRTTLGYGTKAYRGFRLYLQAENVTNVGFEDNFNNRGAGDSGNGVTDRPVIVDPPGTELLQSFVEYAADGSTVKLGRQVINLDDQRHVGAVGWRQHWQSFDAVRFTNDRVDNFVFDYAFIDQVQRIFRDDLDTSSHLFHAQYKVDGYGALTGYGYLLRYDDERFSALSRNTIGVEFKGSRPTGSVTLHYEAEFAHQSDASDNPLRVDANYLHLVGGVGVGRLTFRVDWERIGGSREDGQFQFVLGTNHAFNGWVDKFLGTPADGLKDLMVRVDGPLGPIKWQIRYHDFRADTGGSRYGSELDFLATYTASWKQTFALKGGFYNADEFSRDASKIWLWTAYSF